MIDVPLVNNIQGGNRIVNLYSVVKTSSRVGEGELQKLQKPSRKPHMHRTDSTGRQEVVTSNRGTFSRTAPVQSHKWPLWAGVSHLQLARADRNCGEPGAFSKDSWPPKT